MSYLKQFERLENKLRDQVPDVKPICVDETLRSYDCYEWTNDCNHLLWMISEMKHYLEEKSIDKDFDEGKVNRWLGFIQGALWMESLTTIKEEREAIREANDWCKC